MHNAQELVTFVRGTVDELVRAVESGLTVLRMPDGSLTVSLDPRSSLRPLRGDTDPRSVIRHIILATCEKGEAVSMGSTRSIIRTLSNVISARAAGVLASDIKLSAMALMAALPGISTRASMPVIASSLAQLVPDVSCMLIEALKLAGSECKIFVEPSTAGTDAVERVAGHTFNIIPDPQILKSGRWEAIDVRCLIVDGIIDRVSEIDALLQRCHEGRSPMVIFARGFSDETLATLRVNHRRRTLNVMPISVEFDLETVNILLDIAAVLGSDVVSSLKGEVISGVRFDDLPIARSVSCVGTSATLSSFGVDTNIHLKNLIEKRNAESLPAVRRILDRRIRSLSASSVVIRVSDDGSRGSKRLHDIDAGLKVVRSVLQHGAIEAHRLKELNDEYGLLSGVVTDSVCPALTLGAGLHYAVGLSNVLSAGGLLLGEQSVIT